MSNMRKILLVDDDVLSSHTFKMILESILSNDYNIYSLYSGINVVEEIEKNQYGVVFLDNKLPGKDGLSILEEISRKKIDVKVVFLTGFDDEELIEKALQLGAVDYIPKGNTDINRIIDVVNTVCK